jgi:hypothetical protein
MAAPTIPVLSIAHRFNTEVRLGAIVEKGISVIKSYITVESKLWVIVTREADMFWSWFAWAKIVMHDWLVELFALHHNLHIPSSVPSNTDKSKDF